MPMGDWIAAARERAKAAREGVDEQLDALRALGAVAVDVSYDGMGDSGEVDAVLVRGEDMERIEVNGAVEEAFGQLVYAELEEHFPGWENNDGAYGDATWNLRTGEAKLTHNARYTASETYDRVLEPVRVEQGKPEPPEAPSEDERYGVIINEVERARIALARGHADEAAEILDGIHARFP